MNFRTVPGFLVWLSIVSPSAACGPFFADSVLDDSQSALRVPPVSYITELSKLAGVPMAPEIPSGEQEDQIDRSSFAWQITLEEAQLRLEWRGEEVNPEEIERRLKSYRAARRPVAVDFEMVSLRYFPSGENPEIPAVILGAEFPADVADYAEGARLLAIGDREAARGKWKTILERPVKERRLRGAWAAWMLAKTSSELPECLDWYERVEKEVSLGAIDLLEMRAAAKGWRAPRLENPVEGLKLALEAFRNGRSQSVPDLRMMSGKLLEKQNPEHLAAAAADPSVRKLINLDLWATYDRSNSHFATFAETEEMEETDEIDEQGGRSTFPDAWLKALHDHATPPLEEGAALARSLYAMGRYEESRQWLDLSNGSDPLAQWLRAKFDLRVGNLESANQHLTNAIKTYSEQDDWAPANLFREDWMTTPRERVRSSQAKLLADAGVVRVSLQDYTTALDFFMQAGYEEDAAYLAEQVLTTDELIGHVALVAPRPADKEGGVIRENQGKFDHATLTGGPWNYEIRAYIQSLSEGERLRYLLARRLAREERLDEALAYMPKAYRAAFDHYRLLDKARKSGSHKGPALAAITWEQARMHRNWGTRFFSTDVAPDGGLRGWNYPAVDYAQFRVHREGWSYTYADGQMVVTDAVDPMRRAVPAIHIDEVRRAKQHAIRYPYRFHYRYAAADLAWEAAKSLPDNDPQLAFLYHTAGLWIANRDPKAADRFYQALVKRCSKTAEGQAADAKRWFLHDLEPLGELNSLPAEFKSTYVNR